MDIQNSKAQIETGVYAGIPSRQPRRFRLNKKKFARTIILMACFIASVIAVYYFAGKTVPALAETPRVTQLVSSAAPQGNVLAGKIIILDAGHGGFDIGATGTIGEKESDLNLKVAQDLKAELTARGVQVIMTRPDENAIAATKDEDMAKRRQIIQNGSDIVVSVHMNSETDPSVSGPTVMFMKGSVQGEKLAKSIQKSLIEELNPQSQNSARAEGFYILQSGSQPCVIVECGFISNEAEDKLLNQESYQQKLAGAIADGCSGYFEANS